MSATGVSRGAARTGSGLRRIGANIVATLALLVRRPRLDARRGRWPRTGALVGLTLLAIAVLVATMLWFDGPAVAGARRLPRWLVGGFRFVTDFGKSGWFLWPIGLVLLAIAVLGARQLSKTARLVLTALSVRLAFLFIAIGLPSLIDTVLKRLIGRARPFVDGDNVFAFKPFAWRVEYASMPSGHGTTAFAAAIAIGALWPRSRPLMWAYAVAIGLSRVAVTAHHPSDVIASAIFGAIGALLVRNWFAARRLGFTVGTDGAVRRLPGPSFRRTKAVARRLVSA